MVISYDITDRYLMDALITCFSIGIGGIELAPSMTRFAIKLGDLSARAIAKTRTAIYTYRRKNLIKFRSLLKPKQFNVEMEKNDWTTKRIKTPVTERTTLISE